MPERPILFSSEMVRALRENRKTQTRRTRGLDKINENPDAWYLEGEMASHPGVFRFVGPSRTGLLTENHGIRCPYGVAGDRLWTRETWATFDYSYDSIKPSELPRYCHVVYRVDSKTTDDTWRPSIHMPRWASRDTLEVVSARPERLGDIKAWECLMEGMQGDIGNAVPSFARLWEKINGPGSWAKNPWVWRVEFRRLA